MIGADRYAFQKERHNKSNGIATSTSDDATTRSADASFSGHKVEKAASSPKLTQVDHIFPKTKHSQPNSTPVNDYELEGIAPEQDISSHEDCQAHIKKSKAYQLSSTAQQNLESMINSIQAEKHDIIDTLNKSYNTVISITYRGKTYTLLPADRKIESELYLDLCKKTLNKIKQFHEKNFKEDYNHKSHSDKIDHYISTFDSDQPERPLGQIKDTPITLIIGGNHSAPPDNQPVASPYASDDDEASVAPGNPTVSTPNISDEDDDDSVAPGNPTVSTPNISDEDDDDSVAPDNPTVPALYTSHKDDEDNEIEITKISISLENTGDYIDQTTPNEQRTVYPVAPNPKLTQHAQYQNNGTHHTDFANHDDEDLSDYDHIIGNDSNEEIMQQEEAEDRLDYKLSIYVQEVLKKEIQYKENNPSQENKSTKPIGSDYDITLEDRKIKIFAGMSLKFENPNENETPELNLKTVKDRNNFFTSDPSFFGKNSEGVTGIRYEYEQKITDTDANKFLQDSPNLDSGVVALAYIKHIEHTFSNGREDFFKNNDEFKKNLLDNIKPIESNEGESIKKTELVINLYIPKKFIEAVENSNNYLIKGLINAGYDAHEILFTMIKWP